MTGVQSLPWTPLNIHTDSLIHPLHLSLLHICAVAHGWFTEQIWVQQWWLKQAQSFKAEEELETHYRYNWISLQAREWKRKDLSPLWRKWGQNTITVFTALRGGGALAYIYSCGFASLCFCMCGGGVCFTSDNIISQDICTSVRRERERNGFPWCSLKQCIREGQPEDRKCKAGQNNSFSYDCHFGSHTNCMSTLSQLCSKMSILERPLVSGAMEVKKGYRTCKQDHLINKKMLVWVVDGSINLWTLAKEINYCSCQEVTLHNILDWCHLRTVTNNPSIYYLLTTA